MIGAVGRHAGVTAIWTLRRTSALLLAASPIVVVGVMSQSELPGAAFACLCSLAAVLTAAVGSLNEPARGIFSQPSLTRVLPLLPVRDDARDTVTALTAWILSLGVAVVAWQVAALVDGFAPASWEWGWGVQHLTVPTLLLAAGLQLPGWAAGVRASSVSSAGRYAVLLLAAAATIGCAGIASTACTRTSAGSFALASASWPPR